MDDIVLINETRSGVNVKLDLETDPRVERVQVEQDQDKILGVQVQ